MDFTPYLTAAIMLLGILVGTLISPRINQQVSTEYNKKSLIFQKKLEYFEQIIEAVEKNKKLYYNSICKIEEAKKNSEIDKAVEEIKKNRKRFLKMASPLYFNTQRISEKIIYFVGIEKNIFNRISLIKQNKDKKENIVELLKTDLKRLKTSGNEIVSEMKKELLR